MKMPSTVKVWPIDSGTYQFMLLASLQECFPGISTGMTYQRPEYTHLQPL